MPSSFNNLYKNIKDNALFLILEEGKEVSKYKFIPIKKDIINYKDINDNNKPKSRIFTIRQCFFTKKYNYIDTTNSLLFDSVLELINYCKNKYNYELVL